MAPSRLPAPASHSGVEDEISLALQVRKLIVSEGFWHTRLPRTTHLAHICPVGVPCASVQRSAMHVVHVSGLVVEEIPEILDGLWATSSADPSPSCAVAPGCHDPANSVWERGGGVPVHLRLRSCAVRHTMVILFWLEPAVGLDGCSHVLYTQQHRQKSAKTGRTSCWLFAPMAVCMEHGYGGTFHRVLQRRSHNPRTGAARVYPIRGSFQRRETGK